MAANQANKSIASVTQGDETPEQTQKQLVAVAGLGEVDLNNLSGYQKEKLDALTSKK